MDSVNARPDEQRNPIAHGLHAEVWVPEEPQVSHPCQRSHLSTLEKQSWCQPIRIRVSSSGNSGSDGRVNSFDNSIGAGFQFAPVAHKKCWKNYIPSVGIQIVKIFPPSVPRGTVHSLAVTGKGYGRVTFRLLAMLKIGIWMGEKLELCLRHFVSFKNIQHFWTTCYHEVTLLFARWPTLLAPAFRKRGLSNNKIIKWLSQGCMARSVVTVQIVKVPCSMSERIVS